MDWQGLTILAAFTSVLIAALLLMFSRIFDFRMLEQAAKAELMFAASSVFVAIFLVALIEYGTEIGRAVAGDMYIYTYQHVGYLNYTDKNGTQHTLDPSLFGQGGPSLIELTISYMRSVMLCARFLGSSAFYFSLVAHEIPSISQDVFMAYPFGGWVWSGLAQIADNFLNTIYFMELIYRLQVYVLKFMDIFTLFYLLPIGIVMRAFPLTRSAGAYVIAFAVAFYLIYPLAYLAAVFSSPYPPLCTFPEIPQPSLGENSKSSIAQEFMMWYRSFEGEILNLLGNLSTLTNALLTNLCFFPFIALTITMTAMQFSAGLFGANIPEVGRGLIKLI